MLRAASAGRTAALATTPLGGARTAHMAVASHTDTELRPVTQVVQGRKQMEGAGVRICRTIGTGALRNLDPFLMLDELRMPSHLATAGFPDHPHRGFETCSIMLQGEMRHADSYGNKGVISAGGVQWMTAGRGIVHSEMPVVTDGDLWGFQLWINLPARDKMSKPLYQDYQPDVIPVAESDGARVRVMAGVASGLKGPIAMRNPGMLLDVTLQPGATWEEQVPAGWTAFAYVCDGHGRLSGRAVSREQLAVFGAGGRVAAAAAPSAPLRFLLAAGAPIGEPIVQHGPFVMNTQEEIQQAFRDHYAGKLQDPRDDVWAAA